MVGCALARLGPPPEIAARFRPPLRGKAGRKSIGRSLAAPLSGLLLFLFALAPAFAVQPDEVLSDPALEARARSLSAELRCMVCQNQSIDDSDAPLARDLRVLLRERIAAGDSDADVMNFLVARYGEFILLRPRLNAHTAILWAAPFAVLVVGAGVAVVLFRRRGERVTPQLDSREEERVKRLISGG